MDTDRIKSVIALMTPEEKARLSAADKSLVSYGLDRLKVPSFKLNAQLNPLEPSVNWLPLAASFDTELCAAAAKIMSDASMFCGEIFGGTVSLAVTRFPFSVFTRYSFGEDAFLVGSMAEAAVSGQGLRWAAVNLLGEGYFADRWIDMRALEEVYLAPFRKIGKKLGCAVLPGGRLNGVYNNLNKALTAKLSEYAGKTTLLAEEAGSGGEAVQTCACGLYALSPRPYGEIEVSIRNGTLDERRLNSVLEKLIFAGVEHHEYVKKNHAESIDNMRICEIEKRVAAESAVLLKNNGLLPFKDVSGLAFIGDVGSFGGEGKELAKSKNYARGYVAGSKPSAPLIKKAAEVCQRTDAAVVVLTAQGGKLSEGEKVLIEELSRLNKNLTAVIVSPSPVEFAYDYAFKAFLYMSTDCAFTLASMVDILTGKINPSGKLPFTWAVAAEDYPLNSSVRCKGADMLCYESVYNGYRYFDQFNVAPLYAFGHGLGYCDAEISSLKADCEDDILRIRFVIKNVGQRSAKFAAQVYAKVEGDKIFGLNKRLIAFKKVGLEKTENTSVELRVDLNEFSVYDPDDGTRFIPGGKWEISVGLSSRDLRASVTVKVPKPARRMLALDSASVPSYFKDKDFNPLGAEIEKVLKCPLLGALSGDERLGRRGKITPAAKKLFKYYKPSYPLPAKESELADKLKSLPEFVLERLKDNFRRSL